MWRQAISACALLVAMGCDNGIGLIVDLKTDLVPGTEFARVEVAHAPQVRAFDWTVFGDRTVSYREHAVFRRGIRLAETSGLAAGTYTVRVRLLDASGRVVAERPIRVELEATRVVTALITRDCRGVACPRPDGDPSLIACLGGRCVTPECTPETPELCPTFCDVDADCTVRVSCARVRCELGVCIAEAIEGECPDQTWCDPERGCVPLVEMSLDGGTSCAACDDGIFCNGVESCAASGCVSGGSPCAAPTTCSEATDTCVTSTCGECSPGGEEWGAACGCGTDHRTCGADCRWGSWECIGGGACSPNAVETSGACSQCGTLRRRCDNNCTWSGWVCEDQGACVPGSEDWGGSCGTCMQDHRTCNGGCQWNPWECLPQPGATCTSGRRPTGNGCACLGWTEYEECQSCNWVNIGCVQETGGLPCGFTCHGEVGCHPTMGNCYCDNGNWINCGGPCL